MVLYHKKDYIIDKLIIFLKRVLDADYFSIRFKDINGNIFDALVKSDSALYKHEIEGKMYVEFDGEELIDSRMHTNDDEIIILDINSEINMLDLGYMLKSLEYNYISYLPDVKMCLKKFFDYIETNSDKITLK